MLDTKVVLDPEVNPFVKASVLRQISFPETEWIVEGLLGTSVRRASLLVGKPEVGKSTLAKQLAVDVAKGQPFLTRPTKRGSVILWQTEDQVQVVNRQLIRLGLRNGDSEVYVFQGDSDRVGMEDISKLLKEDPSINLVIIETLDDLLKIENIKENTAARVAFATFTTQLIVPFNERVSFLALHHLKKAEVAFAGDGLLGATQIRGKTENKIYMTQVNENDETRILWSTKRGGVAFPKTVLVFDPETGRSILGKTIAEAKQNEIEAAKRAAITKLLDIVTQTPGIGQSSLYDRLDGRKQNKIRLVNEAVRTEMIIREGNGAKGSPFTYRMSTLPKEALNAFPGNSSLCG